MQENVPAPAKLITAGQFASMLQISERTLWRKLAGGCLPKPIDIGRCTRWNREEVEQWIADRCPNPE